MNRYSWWHYVLLGLMVLAGILYALPNLPIFSNQPALQIIRSDNSPPKSQLVTRIKQHLEKNQVAISDIHLKKHSVLIRFKDTETQLKAQHLLQQLLGYRYVISLSLASQTPSWLQALGAHPMKLGLDLQGGIHFLLRVELNKLMTNQQSGDLHQMMEQLREHNIRYQSVINSATKGIVLYFHNAIERASGYRLLRRSFNQYQFEEKDKSVRARLTPSGITSIKRYALEQNLYVLRNRVNALGIGEPVIQQQGNHYISIDLPGMQDTAQAKNLIGKTATVKFLLRDDAHDAQQAQATGVIPFGSRLYNYQGQPVLLKNQVILSGDAISQARLGSSNNATPAVDIRIGGSQVARFSRVTSQNVGKSMAVVYVEILPTTKLINGKTVIQHRSVERVISIATIQSALGSQFQITGLETMGYAKQLALLLQSGAYAAPLDIVQSRIIGPSMGKSNIHLGILSAEIGLLLVICFMLVYYRLFGLIANMALILNVVFIIAVLSILNGTMTLPGIAAIVLTIGMAVDANVLINERIREELRNGLSIQASIFRGYERAFTTIVDSNLTTLIVAVVLTGLGSGAVKSFAVNLIIGLLTSMVTAIFCTRAMVNLIYGKRSVSQLSIGIKV